MNVIEPVKQPERTERMSKDGSSSLPAKPQPRRIPKGVPLRPARAMLQEEISGASMFGWLFGKP